LPFLCGELRFDLHSRSSCQSLVAYSTARSKIRDLLTFNHRPKEMTPACAQIEGSEQDYNCGGSVVLFLNAHDRLEDGVVPGSLCLDPAPDNRHSAAA
jgi:hypothetical protein